MSDSNSLPRLSAQNLSELMVASLPTTTDSTLRTPWDAVSLLCHACMLAVEFRLVGLDETEKTDATSDPQTPQPLPASWNSASSDISFRYKHRQSSLEFLVKIGKLGNKAVVNGLGLGDEKVYSFDVDTKDYLSPSSFPYSRTDSKSAEQTAHDLVDLFISAGRLADFSALFKINIIQRLTPNLSKEPSETAGAQAERSTDPAGRQRERDEQTDEARRPRPLDEDPLPQPARPHPFDDPLAINPRPRPHPDFAPPGFEDEYEVLRPPGRGMYPGGPRMPLSGEQDLYPPSLGPNDPLRIGPGRGGPRGGGMHPTADDPMFGGGMGPGGWDDRAPPGARYDPVGPGDEPRGGLGGPRFPRGPGGGFGGGAPHNPFGGFGGGDFI